MDADEDPPDADRWPVHPASAFYGLWPRFTAEEEDAEPVAAGSAAGVEH
ncbi:MAG TPA: hypothetical protein VGC13_17375 [Longimicrobium sp.]|jgi:hypothetical protein